MESRAISVNHHLMQRTATLAQEVLERAKKRKVIWPLPSGFQRKAFQEGDNEDKYLNAAFASVAEHMGHISEECEKYYCCVPPFQFKEYEVAHVFRYHGRLASESLLKAFEDEENKMHPIVEELGCSNSEALIPVKTLEQKDIYIEVSPGTYTISASSAEDKIKQTHVIEVHPGQSINLSFDL
ncbi:A-kinase-interacting protein 1 [Eublepharis macularius]|uniref:A-kinase-interacting protein 1 n=1 Tax=Eublepharis macularius TaxID=481883 RepID=A0AA97IZ82_EUBMA|nr:A-kinase-interacting protein 1 [Eublepharis macularius]XP_054828343.1 A-kinase-interacting protein 1 [Eublepharis macularius]